ncbi:MULTISPECIES: DUF1707 SHOCT-like domain-containing protein [Streptomyces]|nr:MULTISPECIES: DUF1707 domain-containing protein [Streptomyces]MBL3805884.1 DUF1707 domain-containing protein [Streptomyces sp. BRB081]MDQ0294528.1 hypothetical protein [Streptomyces sp. DSM 41037]WPR51892.1 DUF1707 domain-containing protein [Streptomyces sp. S399]WSU37007.1 DUF1707 domain-containing protein [Streptomyces gougerotii]GFH64883.1 hypothetical protein Srut_13970 [Streptomyces rutgersensis]
MTADASNTPVPRDQLRVSHDERDKVVEQLRDAAADGRLDIDELEDRVGRALTAKTYGELAPLTADLPVPAAHTPIPPLVIKSGMQGASRTGRWKVPAKITAHGGMAGVRLDFTRVECPLPEVEIEAYGEMAGVTIVVPEGWFVDSDGVDPGIGGLRNKTLHPETRTPGTPVIRVTGTGGMAGVTIRHPNYLERRRLEKAKAQGR